MSEIKSTLAAREIILKDLAAIYIGNLNTVDNDLILPKTGKYGSSFCWSTNESRFIDETGKVHRPLHGMGNRMKMQKWKKSFLLPCFRKQKRQRLFRFGTSMYTQSRMKGRSFLRWSLYIVQMDAE